MKHDWWKIGWQSAYQTLHSRIDNVWCYSKYWHHPSSDQLVVLLHGQLANSHWWRPIAGMLAQDYNVLAIDFSGMGDSQWRDSYSFDVHVKEVKHAIELMAKKHVVTIGHSYGGLIGLSLASHHQENHVGHILIDSPLTALFNDQPSSSSQSSRLKAQIVHYSSQKAICERFRIVPPQPILIESLAEAVARESAIQDEQGWRWKFDPNVLALFHPGGRLSTEVSAKLAYIAGGSSVFWSESYKSQLEACHIDLSVIPEGYHALPLDVPEALYMQINQQLDRMI